MAAVLGKLTQRVEVDPAKRERGRAGCRRPCRPSPGMRSRGVRTRRLGGALWRMEATVSVSSRMNDSSGVAGMPISARGRRVMASSNQTFSTKVACFTRPRSVVRDGTSDRRACSSVGPSRQWLRSLRCSSRNASNWACAGWPMTSSAEVLGRKDMCAALPARHSFCGLASGVSRTSLQCRARLDPTAPRIAAADQFADHQRERSGGQVTAGVAAGASAAA